MGDDVTKVHVPSVTTEPLPLQLEVVGGIHSGVSIALEDGDYSIGSKVGAGIVLRDEGVAPQHVIICVDGRDIRVEAIGGDFRVGDEEIEAGHGYRLRLPAELTIGSASIKLSRNDDNTSFLDRIPFASQIAARPAAAALGALGCVLAIVAATYSLQTQSGREAPLGSATPVASASGLILPANDTRASDAATALSELKNRLQTAGLTSIDVEADGNHIKVKGRVQETRALEWSAIQRWFDNTYAPGLMLSASVSSTKAMAEPALNLQAIWYGDRPYVIADNGVRYYEGAVMDNGWLIQSIDDERITLKKSEDILTISYK